LFVFYFNALTSNSEHHLSSFSHRSPNTHTHTHTQTKATYRTHPHV